MTLYILVILVITIALIFTLTNGLHDASSVVATMISCGAATPPQAIFLTIVFGLAGALFGGNAVASTIAKIVKIETNPILLIVLSTAIIGAVVWNLITWYFGIPSSSTHALVGGIIGSVWVSFGPSKILWGFQEVNQGNLVGIMAVFVSLIISPLIGFSLAFLLQKILKIALRNAKQTVNHWLKRLQWVSIALLAFSYGSNDTQKVVGLIVLALMSGGFLTEQIVPWWVKVLAGLVLFTGTFFGGWSIIKTLGRKIFTLRPIHSLNSQVVSASSIILATMLGAPVSTSHVIVGTVIGVGSAEEYKMVNWNIGKEILIAWFVTIPASAIISAFIYYPIYFLTKLF